MRQFYFYISIISLSLVGCNSAVDIGENSQATMFENTDVVSSSSDVKTEGDNLIFNGTPITLKQVENGNQPLTIQMVKAEKGDVIFEAQKIPTELYLRNRGLKNEALENALEELKGEQLFYFDISDYRKQDILKTHHKENYEEVIKYLSFEVAKDFLVVAGSDTLQPNYTQFEQSFHLTPYERILVSFSGENLKESIQLVYSDQLFKKGTMHFQFAPENVVMKNNEPLL